MEKLCRSQITLRSRTACFTAIRDVGALPKPNRELSSLLLHFIDVISRIWPNKKENRKNHTNQKKFAKIAGNT